MQAGLLPLVHTERDPRGDPTPANTPGGHALAGLGHLHRQRILLFAVLGLGVMVTAAVLVNVAEVFFVTAVLQAGAAVLGVLGTCWGLGMVAGSRLAAKLTSSRALIMGLCLGGMVMGAGLLAPAVAPTLPVTVLGWIAGGLGNGAQTSPASTHPPAHPRPSTRASVLCYRSDPGHRQPERHRPGRPRCGHLRSRDSRRKGQPAGKDDQQFLHEVCLCG